VKILITGSTGLLGQALIRKLGPSGSVTGLSRHAPSSGADRHVTCDLRDAGRAAQVIQELQPDAVIHAQAQSDVDRCEREPAMAEAQNIETTTHLIEALCPTMAYFVYISTDYVFDGTKGSPYDETDSPHPISVYGTTKLEGERLALQYARGIVVRPSTLFGEGRMNFCDHIIAKLREGQAVEAFSDQMTSPTFTEDLADGLGALLETLRQRSAPSQRVLHMANAGGCSRVEFAHRIADSLGYPRTGIRAIQMVEQHRPASRPACSALTTRYLSHVIGRTLRPWEEALQAYLRQRHLSDVAPGGIAR